MPDLLAGNSYFEKTLLWEIQITSTSTGFLIYSPARFASWRTSSLRARGSLLKEFQYFGITFLASPGSEHFIAAELVNEYSICTLGGDTAENGPNVANVWMNIRAHRTGFLRGRATLQSPPPRDRKKVGLCRHLFIPRSSRNSDFGLLTIRRPIASTLKDATRQFFALIVT